jgi:hypothetical protein
MSVRNAISLFLALSILALLVGCGSSSPKAVAPPGGGFSASSLNGTYVFSTSGSDAASGAFLTVVGDFAANGSRGITGGTFDAADPSTGASVGNTVTGGSYSVGVDGRGQATLNTANGPITLDFVLTTSSHGLVTEFDGNGTGSGTLDLVPGNVAQTALTGLTFSLSGVGLSDLSFATAGTVALNGTGGVTSGVEDYNNDGTATTSQGVSTSSFVTVGTGTSPGTAQLITNFGTLSFDVFAVDSTHVKLIETDNNFFLSGDAYTPATSLPASATLAFTMSGLDASSFPLAVGGTFPVDANSNVIGGGIEDFNDAGSVNTDNAFGGGFSAISGGRSVLTLSTFVNGAANGVSGTYTFAAYPFTSNGVSGIQLLEIDGAGVTSGTAFVQTSTAQPATQGYGLDLSAINLNNGFGTFFEEDDIAEFTNSSSGFTGIVDINDDFSPVSYDQAFSGTYPSAGTATTTEHGNTFVSYNFYPVNASTFLLLEIDGNQVGTGIFEQQNASGTPGTAQPGFSMLHTMVAPHAAMQHKK